MHSWPFCEKKKGATMVVSQEEGSILHGYTKPKATGEHRGLFGSALRYPAQCTRPHSSMPCPGTIWGLNETAQRAARPTSVRTCVMTAQGTLNVNLSV